MTALAAVLHGPPTVGDSGTQATSTLQPLNLGDLNFQLLNRKEKKRTWVEKARLLLIAFDHRWLLTSAHFPSAGIRAMTSPRCMGSGEMAGALEEEVAP